MPALPPLRALIALALIAYAASAFADLWAYVDAQGHSHVANRQVDARYTLFFKGETTLDAPQASVEERSRAVAPARAQRFAPLIEANARATGLDAALVKAVIAVESAFDPRAMSGRGAIGLMQVLPKPRNATASPAISGTRSPTSCAIRQRTFASARATCATFSRVSRATCRSRWQRTTPVKVRWRRITTACRPSPKRAIT